MDAAVDRIRAKIAELEAKIANLRIAEQELALLESGPQSRQKPAPSPSPRPAKTEAEEPKRQTIGAAIAEVLGEHGPLPVADIAQQIQANGRDIDNRSVSFSLQAMKKQGVVKSGSGGWALSKGRAKAAAPKAAAKTRAERSPKVQEAKSGTVAAAISDALNRRGALPLAELSEEIRLAGRDVSSRTLSNTLQALKKRGAVKSGDGKWALA